MLYLANHLGYESALRLMKTYHVGTARKWENATVFWQTDISGKIRTGKIMQYNAKTGKRIKEPYAHVSWVHTELDIPEFHLQQCYFGEHLLYNSRKPVAIVESEKTAIIASFYIPMQLFRKSRQTLVFNKFKTCLKNSDTRKIQYCSI